MVGGAVVFFFVGFAFRIASKRYPIPKLFPVPTKEATPVSTETKPANNNDSTVHSLTPVAVDERYDYFGIRHRDEPGRRTDRLLPVSRLGGVIIIFALLLLIAAWAWQENAQSQSDSIQREFSRGDYSHLSEYQDLLDSARNAGRLWNLGVIVAVFGAAVVAFESVRK